MKRVCAFPPRSSLHREVAGRGQQDAPPARTDGHSVPSHPPTTRGRPSAHLCFTPTRRTLAAALNFRTARPRASSSRCVPRHADCSSLQPRSSFVAAIVVPRLAKVTSMRSHPNGRRSHSRQPPNISASRSSPPRLTLGAAIGEPIQWGRATFVFDGRSTCYGRREVS